MALIAMSTSYSLSQRKNRANIDNLIYTSRKVVTVFLKFQAFGSASLLRHDIAIFDTKVASRQVPLE
jgi:hypothetical protein